MGRNIPVVIRDGKPFWDFGDRLLPVVSGGDGPTDTKTEPSLLERLKAAKTVAEEKAMAFIDAREKVETDFELRQAGDSKPSADEVKAHAEARAAYRAEVDQLWAEVHEWDERIADQTKVEDARTAARVASEIAERAKGGAVIKREPLMYMREKARQHDGNAPISYWSDIAATGVKNLTLRTNNRSDAEARLRRHAEEMSVELPKRMKAKIERAQAQIETAEGRGQRRGLDFDPFHRGMVDNPFERRVEPNLTQGQGGYAVPPLWLIDDFIPGLRAKLIAAALCRQMDLPPGTDSINIPKLANLTSVGYQQANNAGLVSTDWSDTAVQGNVKTFGGYSDVAIQVLELSPNQIADEVITTDLHMAYNTFLDLQVIAGDGVSTTALNGGHLLGLYPSTNWSSTNTVTYTQGTPSAVGYIPSLGAMASKIARTRYSVENFKLLMHPRRWFWYSTQLDSNDRPLGESAAGGRFNIAAAVESGLQSEGLVGQLTWLADALVYMDANVPTTDSSGTPGAGTADVTIGALWDDVWLFLGDLRTAVYNEILSATLGVRFQLWNYGAMLVRYGQSLAIMSGSGLAIPSTGYGDNF